MTNLKKTPATELVSLACQEPAERLYATIHPDLQACKDSNAVCMDGLPNLKTFPQSGCRAVFKLYAFKDLPNDLFEWAFELNSYVAAQDTGWTDRRKKKEMSEEDGRYLIAHNPDTNRPVGFIYFQFLAEESYDDEDAQHGDAPVVYWYVTYVRILVFNTKVLSLELQIEPAWQGKGLGSVMLQAIETLGSHHKMAKAMLTAFKSNEQALSFYSKRG
ncbi:hypothetical protein HDU67_004051 [Dinochytrium kinnereticum]|nr:hypothetical protein HDU67_004051 [Dinochytrium kinnereticum]